MVIKKKYKNSIICEFIDQKIFILLMFKIKKFFQLNN
jgi:hypothetical protein